MNEQRLNTLFKEYLNNSLTDRETDEFYSLLDENKDLLQLDEETRKLWQEAEVFQNTSSLRGRNRIKSVLDHINPEKNRSTQLGLIRRVAAAAAIVIALGLFLWQHNHNPISTTEWKTVTTGFGEQKTVLFPDSTAVRISPGSTLRYNNAYNHLNREVELDGQAFFEVARNEEIPFIVRNGNLYTKVLGTSFMVNAFSQDKQIDITVMSGKVEVVTVGDSVHASSLVATLLPHDQLVYSKEERLAKVSRIENLDALTAWQRKILVVESLRFEELAVLLQRWYGVETVFANENIKTCTFTGTFDHLELQQVLELLAMTTDFRYTIEGQKLLIDGNGC